MIFNAFIKNYEIIFHEIHLFLVYKKYKKTFYICTVKVVYMHFLEEKINLIEQTILNLYNYFNNNDERIKFKKRFL